MALADIGPYLAPSAIDFLLVCTWRKAHFPPQQPGATALAPGEAGKRKAEAFRCKSYLLLFYRPKHYANAILQLTEKYLV